MSERSEHLTERSEVSNGHCNRHSASRRRRRTVGREARR
jgi:hypothetical protein